MTNFSYWFSKNGRHIFVEDVDDKLFKQEIQYLKSSKCPDKYKALVLKETPKIWQDIGLPNFEIRISKGTYKKCVLNKHDIEQNEFKFLPHFLKNPMYIFKSSTVNNAFVGVCKIRGNQTPLIVAIKPTGGVLNIISSYYAKDVDFIKREQERGNLLYKKT